MKVAINKVNGDYPKEFPYNPDTQYSDYRGVISQDANPVYESVRNSFKELGYDAVNFNTPVWNPLGFLVAPGNRVFIKPNFVASEYRKSCKKNGNLYSVITHPSVIRAVIDYVAIALDGKGEIIIGDTPSIDADFAKLAKASRLEELAQFYQGKFGISCRIMDLRDCRCEDLKDYGFGFKMKPLSGDPQGYSVLDLKEQSLFYGHNPLLFRAVYNKRAETIKHHHGKTHEYCFPNTLLNTDVFISIPKLKAHRKVGLTANIKGLVGTSSKKNWLIHWKLGYPKFGGDEYPNPNRKRDYFILFFRHLVNDILPERLYYWLKQKTKKTFLYSMFQTERAPSGRAHRGAWSGNDTCWRMVTDLFNAFIMDKTKHIEKIKGSKIKTLAIVDGVIAGEGDGPFCPDEKKSKVIISGCDFICVDTVCARIMDFNYKKISYLDHLIKINNVDVNNIDIVSNCFEENDFFAKEKEYLNFKAPVDWEGLKT